MSRTRSTIAIVLLAAVLAAGATLRAQQGIRPKELSSLLKKGR